MERTVPSTASEEVELYLRTYYSLLRSSAEVQIRTLEEVHAGMHSLLHPGARSDVPDMPAFIYALLRLPPEMIQVRVIVLGQSIDVFKRGGYQVDQGWQVVTAPARRRRCLYDERETMACFIASRSDIDDVIPILTAYQIEWNKIHLLLQRLPTSVNLHRFEEDSEVQETLAEALGISWDDLQRLYAVWRDDFIPNLEIIRAAPRYLKVKLLSGSFSEYRRATNSWWERIEQTCPELKSRPIYFVSSNSHSMANIFSGFAIRRQEQLINYLERSKNKALLAEWLDIESGKTPSHRENFLYYILKKYQSTQAGYKLIEEQMAEERGAGLYRINSEQSFEVEAQVLHLKQLDPEWLDRRLDFTEGSLLQKSDALILNIDYPLGLAAYNILSKVAESVGSILGIYIMGKAASLNGVVGDVMVPNVVHDEHSSNTYIFPNCFNAEHVSPYLMHGTVLDNQKAVTVQGTFLQNEDYMDVFYREGYTGIEMEAGAYLSACYEMHRPKRHPVNEIVNLYGIPFDLGIIHYVSDTPLGKGKNLGAGSLSYFGMDSTYATSIAIVRRIFALEQQRLGKKQESGLGR
jgi:hypothetical protein